LVSSFAASIDHDTNWMAIIESAVKQCFETIPFNPKFDCVKGLTYEYTRVIVCTSVKLYSHCPYPSELENCKWATKYVENCVKF